MHANFPFSLEIALFHTRKKTKNGKGGILLVKPAFLRAGFAGHSVTSQYGGVSAKTLGEISATKLIKRGVVNAAH